MTDATTVLRPQPVGIPVPRPSLASRPYWDATARHELHYQRCDDCGTIASAGPGAARASGARCRGSRLRDSGASTPGRSCTARSTRRSSFPTLPAIVELDEGFWLVSSIIGCPAGALTAGLRLRAEFHPASDEITLPYFRPA